MTWWLKLRRRRQLEKDLNDEMAFHRAMRAGDAEAPSFGNETQIRETARDLWRFQWLETTWHDVRYALRTLRRQPGFTMIVVLTLALGIGANTAVFSVVNGVVLRPLSYPEAERLEFVVTEFPSLGFDRFAMSIPEFLEFRDNGTAFESMGAYTVGTLTLGTNQPSRQTGAAISPDLLATLKVQPTIGRGFHADDSRPGADPVALLSHGLWQREFGGAPGAIGRRIDINRKPTLIVGVMPRGFDVHDERVMLWVPLTIDPSGAGRTEHSFWVIARRRADVDRVQAQADTDRLVARWGEIAPKVHTPGNPGHRVRLVPLLDDMVSEVRGTLWILQAAVGVVLLIACVNLANLLIARADSRAQEHALRVALGASRGRLLRQLTTEGLVVATLSAVVGVGLAQSGLSLMLVSYPDAIPRIGDVSLDWRVLGFTAAVTIATAFVFGLVPLAHLAKGRVDAELRFSSRRMTGGAARSRLRSALIVAEVAMAVLLVTGAGLLLRSFVNLTRVDVGFDRSGLSTFQLALPGATYDAGRRADFYQRLIANLEGVPGVRSAAVMTGLPPLRGMNSSDTDFAHIEAHHAGDDIPAENVDFYQTVSLGYTETLGARVTAGRDFEPTDVSGAPVVLVNEALARKFFKGGNPVGQRLRPGFSDARPWFTIVGVLGDVKQSGVAKAAGTEAYFLLEQGQRVTVATPGVVHILVRSSLPFATLAPQFRREISELDRSLPITAMRTIDEAIGTSIARQRFLLLLLGLLAGLALVLAALGIYGILAYLVAERRQEIGIRMALGATRQGVVGMVLIRGLGATALGLVCGLVASVGLTGMLASLLFEVGPHDPVTLTAVCSVMLFVAVGACIVPAWRASRVSPITALRS